MMDTNPNIAAGDDSASSTPAKKARGRRKMRRTVAGAFALTIGLTGAGVLATALTPDAQIATAQRDDQALIQEGKDLYDVACITCHGANLQGVQDRGPSLVGVGEGAVYFQVHSGRMPMMSNDAQAERKAPRYTEAQTLAMAAYISANGGGPELVYNEDGTIAMEELRGSNYDGIMDAQDIARGG
ncbi:MAG: cytochrome c, partial [Corynebacterium marinum]|nr:cytochrome c [Corynebacterium marinum]